MQEKKAITLHCSLQTLVFIAFSFQLLFSVFMASKLSEYCKVLQSNILIVVKTVTTVKILCCVEYNFVWFHLVCCVFVNYIL